MALALRPSAVYIAAPMRRLMTPCFTVTCDVPVAWPFLSPALMNMTDGIKIAQLEPSTVSASRAA